MLTVIREMATAAQAVPDGFGLEHLLAAIEEAGRIAVENTTAQLPALQKAGVVDAGGYGLLVLFRGLADGIEDLMHGGKVVAGARLAARVATEPWPAPRGTPASRAGVTVHEPSELSEYRYCTSFLITGEGIDREAFEEFLLPIGDSALVVGDAAHRQSARARERPRRRAHRGHQARCHRGRRDQRHARPDARPRRAALAPAAPEVGEGGAVVVAVVAGAGNQQLFRDLGCHAIVDGGQSMNPSAAQLLDGRRVPRRRGGRHPAQQRQRHPHGRAGGRHELPAHRGGALTFHPQRTRRHDRLRPEQDAVGNARIMQDAIVDVRYAEVTHAVRDSELDGLEVRKGQAMAIVDGRLVAAADALEEAFAGMLEEFARGDAEYVTVLTALNGSGTTREELQDLAARVAPDAEISFHEGGQPLYPILASAE